MRSFKSNLVALLAFIGFTGLSSLVSGQVMPEVSVRFANPQFDAATRSYCLDVEMRTGAGQQQLFGMNVRFFYDATMMEFRGLDQFYPGYGLLGNAPQNFRGNTAGGTQMFGLDGAAAFVNGAIQLLNDQSPMQVVNNQWTKAFRACFEVPAGMLGADSFCPSLIWDAKPQARKGGFMPGSDGLVLTVVENNPNTREVSAPATASGMHFNWQKAEGDNMPYGVPQSGVCISLSGLVSSSGVVTSDPRGFALYQNQPNPFTQNTSIEFILPDSRTARIAFFDVSGKMLKVIEGDFAAGRNIVKLDRSPWMESSGVWFYRLESGDYISGMRKITLINP